MGSLYILPALVRTVSKTEKSMVRMLDPENIKARNFGHQELALEELFSTRKPFSIHHTQHVNYSVPQNIHSEQKQVNFGYYFLNTQVAEWQHCRGLEAGDRSQDCRDCLWHELVMEGSRMIR